MAEDGHDAALDALWRLLGDAAEGGQAKVDAIVALSQRTVFAATWQAEGQGGFRTLLNSNGESALPIFTTHHELEESARRFGWFQPDGALFSTELGARQALRHVVNENLAFLVVDIATDHTLEVERAELEPLVSSGSASDSQGPFAGVGRISSEMIRRVRPTPPPMQAVDPNAAAKPAAIEPPRDYGDAVRESSSGGVAAPVAPPPVAPAPAQAPAPSPSSSGLSVSADMTGSSGGVSASFGAGSSVEFHPLAEQPSDELLDALSAVLRDFPEVEWAVFSNASRGPVAPQPTIGLRVDTAFRARVGEIIPALKKKADERGATVDVFLLDDPKLMRAARADQLVFFPWRR